MHLLFTLVLVAPLLGGNKTSPNAIQPCKNDLMEHRSELGAGGFGKVFIVHYKGGKTLGNAAVLKIFKDKEEGKREIQNFNALKAFQGKFIPRLQGYCEEDGKLGIVMNGLWGGDLQKLFDQKFQFTHEQMKQIMNQILNAITELNNSNISHCDLKPGNVGIVRSVVPGRYDNPVDNYWSQPSFQFSNQVRLLDVGGVEFHYLKAKGAEGQDKFHLGAFTRKYTPCKVTQTGRGDETMDSYAVGIILAQMLASNRCVQFEFGKDCNEVKDNVISEFSRTPTLKAFKEASRTNPSRCQSISRRRGRWGDS